MNGYEVIYTGGGVWLSFYHEKVGDDVLGYMVDNLEPAALTCFKNIGEDYELYDDNIVMETSVGDQDYSKYKELHEKLVENLYKEMW